MKPGPNAVPWDTLILDLLSAPRTVRQVKNEIGCSHTTAWSHVASLRRRGLVRRYRRGRLGGGSRVWYSVTLAGRATGGG